MIVKFVRHGETDLNSPIRRMQGISDYDLNIIVIAHLLKIKNVKYRNNI